MEFIIEIIIQFFGELLLQILCEGLAEIGVRGIENVFKKPQHPVLASIGYFLLGAIVGGLSLYIFRASFITNYSLKITNLFLTPLLIGFMMMGLGMLRKKQGKELVKLDKFTYAFIFAFSMSLVRFIWAR